MTTFKRKNTYIGNLFDEGIKDLAKVESYIREASKARLSYNNNDYVQNLQKLAKDVNSKMDIGASIQKLDTNLQTVIKNERESQAMASRQQSATNTQANNPEANPNQNTLKFNPPIWNDPNA